MERSWNDEGDDEDETEADEFVLAADDRSEVTLLLFLFLLKLIILPWGNSVLCVLDVMCVAHLAEYGNGAVQRRPGV